MTARKRPSACRLLPACILVCAQAGADGLCVSSGGDAGAWLALGYDSSDCDVHFTQIDAALQAAAASGDTLILSLNDDQVHVVQSAAPPGKSFGIRNAHGDLDASSCIVETSGAGMVQDLSAGGIVTLRGLTIRNGTAPPALEVTGSALADAELRLESVHFLANVSSDSAIRKPAALALLTAPNGHEVAYSIIDGVFEDNTHLGGGGGAVSFVEGSRLTILGSRFERNLVDEGQGGALWINKARKADGCSVSIETSEFYSNTAASGGAVLAMKDCSLTMRDSIVGAEGRGNYVSNDSGFVRGVIFMLTEDTPVSLVVQDSEFVYNTTNPLGDPGDGGVFRVTNEAVGFGTVAALFEDNLFAHNEAWSGPAIHAGGETVARVRRCVFRENRARDGAGAYFASGTRDSPPFGLHTLEHNIFVANTADADGGAIKIAAYTHAQVRNCTFVGNLAGRDGNHIYAKATLGGEHSSVRNSLFWTDIPNGLYDIAAEAGGAFTEFVSNAHREGALFDPGASISDPVYLVRSPVLSDLRLRASSLCIDAGADLPAGQPPYDVYGRDVPAGAGPDIGALEYWIDRTRSPRPPPVGTPQTARQSPPLAAYP